MNDQLKEYSLEVYGNDSHTLTLEFLIESHRILLKKARASSAEIAAEREAVREHTKITSEQWLKHGEYIHRDKLLSMSMQEIVEFLS